MTAFNKASETVETKQKEQLHHIKMYHHARKQSTINYFLPANHKWDSVVFAAIIHQAQSRGGEGFEESSGDT